MDESKKKPIMIGAIVVCLVAAGLITLATRGGRGGLETIPEESITWVKCRNEKCLDGWEMNTREYYKYLEEHHEPGSLFAPPIPCPKCGAESGYEAFKCPKCNKVWEKGTVSRDFEDRCPECKYSQIEVDRRVKAGLPPEKTE